MDQCMVDIGDGSAYNGDEVVLIGRQGDEVITVANSFIATSEAITMSGARVVFVDIDSQNYNIDTRLIEAKITPKTRAIIPVHLFGQPCDMDPIMRLAKKHNLTVIEDAAHAFGAKYNGKMAGTLGHFGSFSFHEVKNINSLGEGGLLATNTAYGKDFAKSLD